MERPILFSPPMVRAILEGRKMVTRRVVDLTKQGCDSSQPAKEATWARCIEDRWEWWGTLNEERRGLLYQHTVKCPYGTVGDQLWLREAFQLETLCEDIPAGILGSGSATRYCADGFVRGEAIDHFGRVRTARFMPKWASRITLEITGVKVERLQEITEEDILAEGVDQGLVSNVISPIALRAGAVAEHWIGGYDEGFSFCRGCAEKELKRLKRTHPAKEFHLDGGWATEGDSQAFCETCHRVLDNNFTTYACQQEINHFSENGWSLHPLDCLSLQNILGSYGWDDYDKCEPADRIGPQIHRLGWQALWDSLNGKREGCTWTDNPWVWAISFKRLES